MRASGVALGRGLVVGVLVATIVAVAGCGARRGAAPTGVYHRVEAGDNLYRTRFPSG